MELSIEVIGFIQDKLVSEEFSWGKIDAFSRRIGVDISDIDEKTRRNNLMKRGVVNEIMNRLANDKAEIVLKSFLDMSRKAAWDKNIRSKIFPELERLVNMTMNCELTIEGELSPILSGRRHIPINKFLTNLSGKNLQKTSVLYEGALKSFLNAPDTALAGLRASYEQLVEEILQIKGITFARMNLKDRLSELLKLNLIKDLSFQQCVKCQYDKRNHEFNFAYTLYGLLSYYGGHGGQVVDKSTADWIFSSVTSFMELLVNRI